MFNISFSSISRHFLSTRILMTTTTQYGCELFGDFPPHAQAADVLGNVVNLASIRFLPFPFTHPRKRT